MQREDKITLLAWKMFDWAAQPYFTLIATFLFPPFFVSALASDPVNGQIIWGWTMALAALSTALLSPIIGHFSDRRRNIKQPFIATGLIAVTSSSLIWYCAPGSSTSVYIAAALFVLATVGFEISTSLNNAMLPMICSNTERTKAAWSGWALGSLSGLVVLFLFLAMLSVVPIRIEPLGSLVITANDVMRFVGPFTAIWFAIFCIPIIVAYKDDPNHYHMNIEGTDASQKVKKSTRQYLFASMLLNDGLTALFAFGTIYAAAIFDWKMKELMLLAIILTTAGYLGVVGGSLLEHRLGSEKISFIASAAIVASGLIVLGLDQEHIFGLEAKALNNMIIKNTAELIFILMSVVIGASSAALQSTLRVMYLGYVPIQNAGRSFGFFSFSGKVTTFIGPILVALAIEHFQNIKAGMTAVLFLIVAGAILMRAITNQK